MPFFFLEKCISGRGMNANELKILNRIKESIAYLKV